MVYDKSISTETYDRNTGWYICFCSNKRNNNSILFHIYIQTEYKCIKEYLRICFLMFVIVTYFCQIFKHIMSNMSVNMFFDILFRYPILLTVIPFT